MTQRKGFLYGPFHRLQPAADNERVEKSGQLWGFDARNIYAGDEAAAKAKDGPLPPGRTGIEFRTNVKPRTIGRPGPGAEVWWDRGSPGVEEVEGHDAVFIPVTITKRVD